MNYRLVVLMCFISILSMGLSANVASHNTMIAEKANINPAPDAPTGSAFQQFCTIENATIFDLEANGSNIQWYVSGNSSTPLDPITPLTSGEDYFATQTVAGCESTDRLAVTVFIGNPNPPTTNSPQEFCLADNPTIADLVAVGTDIKWYATDNSTTELIPTTPLIDGEDYFATQTVSSCESISRTQLFVTINDTPSPSADIAQEFCAIDEPTVADLVAIGTDLSWYGEQSDNIALLSTETLIDGEDYFVSQIINGCESAVRLEVLVTVNDVSVPTGNANQTFCATNVPTVASLQANGSNILWYETASSTTALATNVALVDGEDYFATQTVDGCESDERLEVVVDIETTIAPTTSNSSQEFCAIDNPTLGDLEVSGANISWYEDATTNTALDPSTALVGGEDYFATQTINGCESGNRLQVDVFIFDVAAPSTTNPIQTFCGIDNPTIADLSASGVNPNIAWYADINATVPLSPITPLTDGEDYFAADSINGCEGTQRLQVDVSLENPAAPTTNNTTQIHCSIDNPTIADIQVTGTNITWYSDISSDIALPLTTPLVDGEDYYATQTIGTCESDMRLQISVLVLDTPTPTTATANPTFCIVDNPTLADIFVAGTALQWYDDPAMTLPLPTTTALVDGENYYVTQTIGTCESALPLEIVPSVGDVPPPTTNDIVQSFCSDQDPTLADLNVTSTGTSVQWYDEANSTILLPLSTPLVNGEDYFATQTDGGCESSQSLQITVEVVNTPNNALLVNAMDALICEGGSTIIQVLNSETNVAYQLVDMSNSANIGSPVAGTGGTIDLPTGTITSTTFFNVIASSTQFIGCQSTLLAQTTVVVDAAPTAPNAGGDQTLCNQTSTVMEGNIPSIGTGMWTQISGPNTAMIDDASDPTTGVSDMIEGIYTFEWQVSNGVCANVPQFADTVAVSISSISVTTTVIPESIVGLNDGLIGLCIEGGTAPYNIEWTPNDVGALNEVTSPSCNDYYEISGLSAGMYEVVVTDANGCSRTFAGASSILVEGPDCSAFEVNTTLTATSMVGASDGVIGLCAEGGTAPYSISWTPNDVGTLNQVTSPTCNDYYEISGLPEGSYEVVITDVDGCTVTFSETNSISVEGPDCSAFGVNTTLTATSMVGVSDGVIGFCPENGTAPYSIEWIPNDVGTLNQVTSPTCNDYYEISGLPEGLYQAVITDANGCVINFSGVNSISLEGPDCSAFEVNTTLTSISAVGASDGVIGFCAENGTAPYSVSWTPNDVGTLNQITSPTCNNYYEISGLPADLYQAVITDANGCVFSFTGANSIPIQEPGCDDFDVDITLTATSTVGASDGVIGLCPENGTAPYDIVWTPNNGGTLNQVTSPTCNDYYEISGLPLDLYQVIITDADGCIVNFAGANSIQIEEPDCSNFEVSTTLTSISMVGASDGVIGLCAENGMAPYSIEWTPNDVGTLNQVTSPTCNEYYEISGLPEDLYQVVITDASGCVVDFIGANSIPIQEPGCDDFEVIPTITATSVVGASDGVIGLCPENGTAPFSIEWTPNNVGTLNQITSPTCNEYYEISGLPEDLYQVVVTDADGCIVTLAGANSILVEGPDCDNFEISNVSFLPENCFNNDDGRITIETTGGTGDITYDIGNGMTPVVSSATTVTFDDLAAGNYTITVVDELLCEVTYPDIITITQPDLIEANISTISPSEVGVTDGVVCISPQGGVAPYSVTADCGTVIEGSGICGGDFYIENLGDESCTIQIVDFAGCIITEVVSLQEPACDDFEISSIISEDPFCNGDMMGSIEISVNGGASPYQYSIDGGTTFTTEASTTFMFENLGGGSYDVVVLDDLGCGVTSTQAVEIIEPGELTVDLSEVINDCASTEAGVISLVVFGGTPDYTFLWSDGTETAVNENLSAGDYTITVTDANGCTVSGTTSIVNLDGFNLELQADGTVVDEITIEEGESVELSVITDAVDPTFEWIPIEGLSATNTATVMASPTETTEYIVSVMNDEGCLLSASIIINVNPLDSEDNIIIPNAFSPNNDGNNDTFYPILEGTANITEFKIYNRWGELIYSDPSMPWDGTYKGKEQLLDTYVYVITYETATTSSTTVSGDILLVR